MSNAACPGGWQATSACYCGTAPPTPALKTQQVGYAGRVVETGCVLGRKRQRVV